MLNQKDIKTIRIILGIIVLVFSFLSIFVPINGINIQIGINIPINKEGLFVLIISALGLLALSMNFVYQNTLKTIKTKIEENGKTEESEETIPNDGVKISERNAWDVWFYSMPAVILTFLFIGILANNNSEVWKWVAISLGGAVGLGSLTSIIQSLLDLSK
jgi:hypothetical protein